MAVPARVRLADVTAANRGRAVPGVTLGRSGRMLIGRYGC
jgi:hypothetical protein